jgi:thioredoxin-related protein
MNTRHLQTIALAVPALFLSLAPAHAEEGWTEDFARAKETAAKNNLDLLMDFTGSDWCGWCIQLDEEVFSKDAFKKEAPKHFVLVELDFPQDKEQSPAVKEQNEKLQTEYNIEGFPTIVLADAQGRPYAVTGYAEGGPDKYLASLEKLRKLRVARDTMLKKAAAAEGPEKAKLIMAAFKEIDAALVHTFYAKEIDEAIAADKDDASGAKKARTAFETEKAFKGKVAGLEEELSKLHEDEKFDEFAARIDKFIADEKLVGAKKQELMMAKLAVNGPDKLAAALKLLDEIIAVDPKSDMAEQAKMMKENLREMSEQVEKSKKEDGEAEEKDETPPKEEK